MQLDIWRRSCVSKMAGKFGFVLFVAALLIVGGEAKGRTASCPCNPCPCSPCTCGGGGKSSSGGGDKSAAKPHEGTKQTSHEGGKETGRRRERSHEGHHDHGGVGVGVTVDLGGVGQRKTEADPFASSGGGAIPHSEEKHTAKTTDRNVSVSDPFAWIKTTGIEAKGDLPPRGSVNVSDKPAAQNDSETRYKKLAEHLAEYEVLLRAVAKPEIEIVQWQNEAWDANNKLSEGYEDQSLMLIDDGRDTWGQINKDFPVAVRNYKAALEKATRLHDALLQERAAYNADCAGYKPGPDIPDLPEPIGVELPGEWGRD